MEHLLMTKINVHEEKIIFMNNNNNTSSMDKMISMKWIELWTWNQDMKSSEAMILWCWCNDLLNQLSYKARDGESRLFVGSNVPVINESVAEKMYLKWIIEWTVDLESKLLL